MPLLGVFLTTGRIGDIEPGVSLARVRDVLGPSDDESVKRRPVYLLRYGAVQLGFTPIGGTNDYCLTTTAIYFTQPGQEVPAALRFADWSPTAEATETDVVRFAADVGLRPEPHAEWRGENVMFASGASAAFDDGRLHSLHFRRPERPADRAQISVSLPTETVRRLRRQAKEQNVTPADLLDRLINAGA